MIVLILALIGSMTIIAERWSHARVLDAQQELVTDSVATLRARLEVLLAQQRYILNGVASHIRFYPNIGQEDFARYVENFLPPDTVVSMVAAAPAPALEVTRIYPLRGNESVLGLSYRISPSQSATALRAIEQNNMVVAGPVELVQGGAAFVARVPAFEISDEQNATPRLWGLIAAVIPAATFYREAGITSRELGIEVALRGTDASGPSGSVFYGDRQIFNAGADAVTEQIKIGNGSWQLAAIPNGGWNNNTSPLIWLIRIIGLIIAGFLLLGLLFRRRFSRKTEIAEQNFRDLFEANNDALIINDSNTFKILSVNKSAERYLGYPREELVGTDVKDLLPASSRDELNACVHSIRHRNETVFETYLCRKDGSLGHVEVSARRLQRANSDIVLSAVRDISDRKAAEDALRKSQQDLVSAIESINEGFTLWDAEGRLQSYNQRYVDLVPELRDFIKVGVSFEEVLCFGYDKGIVATDFDRDDWVAMRMEAHKQPTGPYEFRTADGRYIKVSEYLTPDESCVGIYEDVTELKRATEHIHYRAYFDVLTGLPNRENFLGKLSETLAAVKRSQQICGLLFIDLDRFKNVNDTLGHNIGDKLLREVALRLRSAIRETDYVARFAGDEFVVLLRYIEAPINALRIVQNLLGKLNASYELEGHEIYCSASIGIALAPNDTMEAEAYLKYADLAMYQAKSVGGNAFRFFKENMTQRAERFFSVEKDLRQSIKDQQLLLNYQPVFDLSINEISSVEALVRWQHPEHGLMLPDEFISVAEETSFIDELGRWVIGEATTNTVDWRSKLQSRPLKVAINVSSRQFWGQFDVQFVREVLDRAGFPPERLIIEITESLVLGEERRIIAVLEDLRNLGVGICIDDFGTGYSAISYLKRLPVTALKIDRSFVHDIERSLDDALLVESIVAMAKALRVKVVAEGVETENQLKLLVEMGCDFGQGLFFGEPLSAVDIRSRFLEPNVVPLLDHAHNKP
ncbi:MAG: bifunctional diguanylate cyclase/phosphodiesterase [Gammaproteobacteria bacterium]